MAEDWHSRWEQGRIGWHEAAGNAALRKYWSALPGKSRVLVPLCGKTLDLLWLEERSLVVTGVELSPIAARSFFDENELTFSVCELGEMTIYSGNERNIRICCGDYFRFAAERFDALYDRGALVAMPPVLREKYARHTDSLLKPGASRLVVTLEYEQSVVAGPPYSVKTDEIQQLWPGLRRVSEKDDLANCPPKFREAGLTEILEVVWITP
ncbi:MAG: thiopurine S-methyltransferase [Gammaproteobacteria bacterium]|nr:thiopurine S-methyltransferase [Gammaproteobacteria bacterium]MDH4315283.1 thiopurine S-methyltransferase [Gammaproteobacteria bacterium]MDH5213951.1 thiopurine S-methyltransferase [Gammaproteobacteria bacterium]MDH5499583.1 thiopurine S-methyltransferase [Gammaproteobacteria bacterium]